VEDGVRRAARLIAGAERPLLMVGHGVILAQAYDDVRALAEKTGIPVITTLLGISAFPDGHPLHLGMPGMHGEVHVNRAIQNADVIIGIGLRFDDRVTGNTASFAPQARIVHVDLDRAEIGKNSRGRRYRGDARDITRRLVAAVEPRRCERWVEHIRGFVRTRAESYRGDLSPEAILASIYEASHGDCTIVRTWVSTRCGWRSCIPTSAPTRTSHRGASAPWGSRCRPPWAFTSPVQRHRVAISGDGGFQMNMPRWRPWCRKGSR